jgi:putative aldouronate transport system substrate-binding protein
MKTNCRLNLRTLLLSLAVVLAFTACTKNEALSEKTNLPENDGPFVPYAETVTVVVPLEDRADVSVPTGETREENLVTNFYTEKLNIKFKGAWQVDISQSKEKLNAAIASNDIPDIFEVNFEMLGRLIKAEQIQPLDNVYKKYASPRLQEILDYQDGRGFLPGYVNGKHYAIPKVDDFASNIVMMYIRKDWLDKLDLAVPTTIDELLTVARAFRDRDPDGNGVNDTIAFGLDRDLGQNRAGINSLANPLGAYTKIWIPDGSGGLMYSSIQPEIKELLTIMQQMYAEGLMDKEFAVKDGNKVAEDVAAGKIGIFPGLFWTPLYPLNMTIDGNSNADYIVVPVMKNKSGKHISQNKIAAVGAYVVRIGYEHPEALIKAMNLWAEMFHGEYSKYFWELVYSEKYNNAGSWHILNLPSFFQHPEKNILKSDNVIEALEAQDINICSNGENRLAYTDILSNNSTVSWVNRLIFGPDGSEQILKQYDNYVYDEFLGSPTNTMIMRTAMLDKLENEAFFAIIMGDHISKFDDFVKDWKAQGGDRITQEVSDWYKSVH